MLNKIEESIGKSEQELSYNKGYIQALRDIYFEIDKIKVKE